MEGLWLRGQNPKPLVFREVLEMILLQMSYSLNSLKGGYRGLYRGLL